VWAVTRFRIQINQGARDNIALWFNVQALS
jgi:hypothetical protein